MRWIPSIEGLEDRKLCDGDPTAPQTMTAPKPAPLNLTIIQIIDLVVPAPTTYGPDNYPDSPWADWYGEGGYGASWGPPAPDPNPAPFPFVTP